MKITIEFYENALQYALNIICKNKISSTIDKYDVGHNVLTNKAVNETNWKNLILQEVKNMSCTNNFVELENIDKKQIEERRICKTCGEVYYLGYFKSSFNKMLQLLQYRNNCKFCHNQIRKKYNIKPLSIEQKEKYNVKRKNKRAQEIAVYGKTIDPTAKERYHRWKLKHKK